MRWMALIGLFVLGEGLCNPVETAKDCPLLEQRPLDEDRQAQLRTALGATDLPGYCAVRFDPERANCVAAGYAQRPDAPYTQSTRQPIGSISKTFIGLALAQLSGSSTNQTPALDLDVPIDRYLPWSVRNPRHKTAAITLRQLATHTSGIRDRPLAYRKSYVARHAISSNLGEYLKSYLLPGGALFKRDNFIDAAPGSTYEYSNIGAALAAYVIEVKLGMSFDHYLQTKILQPLGMQSSFSPRPADAHLYEKDGSQIAPYRLITYPDGGLYASCQDLALYLHAIVEANAGRSSALASDVVRRMLAPQFSSKRPAKLPPKVTDHGLFWEIRGAKTGHTGSDPGVTALLSFDPTNASARLQLSNVDIEESENLTRQFIELWRILE